MDEGTQPVEAPRPARTLTPLRMVWRQALDYPGRVAAAAAALLVTASATLAIPSGLKLIVEQLRSPHARSCSAVPKTWRRPNLGRESWLFRPGPLNTVQYSENTWSVFGDQTQWSGLSARLKASGGHVITDAQRGASRSAPSTL